MMDFIKKIDFLEAEVTRLKAQKEQEEAMLKVIPARFKRNMDAFHRYIPAIYEQFKDFKPRKKFEFFCTENGVPNLLWSDNKKSFYGADPFEECKLQVDSVLNGRNSITTIEFSREDNPLDFIHVKYMNKMMDNQCLASKRLNPIEKVGGEIPLMFMFGIGLGYQISYIYERCKPYAFFIIEPELDLFYASLFTFDWYELFEYINSEDLKLHIFLGQSSDDIIQDVTTAVAKIGSYLSAASVGFWHYKSDQISELITRTTREFFFLVSGWGFFDDNLIAMSHCMENVRNDVPFLVAGKYLDDKWAKIPVFIVGNGPSLDLAIDTLKIYQEKAIILSCGSALSALHRSGIKPDIHVQVERTKIVPDTHRLLNDDEYLKDILFLSVDVIHPDCAKQFDRIGLAFKPFEPGAFLLKNHSIVARQRDTLRAANPLVGNTGLATACRLGFKNIYLFGIDNGYKSDKHHHSKYSFYFDENGKAKEKLSLQVSKKSKYLIPGNFEGEVETTNMMITSKTVMENLLKEYNSVSVNNCSDGAKIEGATPTKINEIYIVDDHVDKVTLLNYIATEMYRPMNIDIESLSEKINVDLFNELVDKFVSAWSRDFLTRQDIITTMMEVYDYFMIVRENNYGHIYRTLIGSVNYSYSVILSTLYRFESSDALFLIVNDIIAIMIEYFISMKEKYIYALSSIDKKEHGLFED
ncbi:motility associated factor glycosyltransferase family protein [Aeromonas caviae]|uniref:motility associated factor glycosyltransferase family protein n=1 Tax=Aeromonas caviae TaxID=648 RepID=UPI002B45E1AE|nr:6-hydroxymethylpterin diphosphokinase MptE-like protein [Aeromonas caviae]